MPPPHEEEENVDKDRPESEAQADEGLEIG